ncbi:MAG: helix-turn-helix transcriptional regulator [Rhodospirillaceae bacterium]|jgi:DNA-binding HxlR family transcriptional regulator|nr:helix-turn-helix transcriptional regulator [Rhodospirillaceae bacterium]MBT6364178.1 helix-turn-helix transcriptional regulator [Rhodospirillaceae bacterium]
MNFPETLSQRSGCPISTTLDILGDKWSLIIIRDMLTGKSRYGEFQDSPEGIPTNILAARLKRLEVAGLVLKSPYQERPVRFAYTLTESGKALKPVVQAICRWANEFFPETWVPPAYFMKP